MRHFAFVLFLTGWAATACVPEGHTLSVDVITDIVPGPEFDVVDVTLFPAGTTRTASMEPRALREQSVGLADAAAFRRGRRVADFPATPDGPFSLRVRLRSPDRGAVLIERWSSLVMRGSTRILIDLDARCIELVCPAPEGSPGFSECSQGRCVEPTCNLEDPTSWAHCCDPNDPRANCALPFYCTANTDCAARATDCSDSMCEQRVCIDVARENACPDNFYCAHANGCQPVPDVFQDAGLDSGPRDAAESDTSRLDARTGVVEDAGSDAGADATIGMDASMDAGATGIDAPDMIFVRDAGSGADTGGGASDGGAGDGGARILDGGADTARGALLDAAPDLLDASRPL